MSTASIGARIDRLPVGKFHWKLFYIVAVGMFFEGFDIYIAASVLAGTTSTGFSTFAQNGLFISATFVGMTLGALLTGFLGDRYGRRRTYQWNLLLFGAAAIASAFAPDMQTLIILRFLMGLGLGAENVVGYSIIAEFFPSKTRGRWAGMICTAVTLGLPASAIMAWLLIPIFGWRVMFVLGGIGALIAWLLRTKLPESPRWLEIAGRGAEAEKLVSEIEREIERERGALPAPDLTPPPAIARDLGQLFREPLLSRVIVGSVSLMVVNTLIYGFIVWMPTFFVSQGQTITKSTGFALLMALGGPLGSTLGALACDALGRKVTIVGSALIGVLLSAAFALSTDVLVTVSLGFLLTIPIYVLVAALFAVYIPEIFPTEFRLRGVGLCNAVGRSASIIVPLFIGPVFVSYGVVGVLSVMSAALLLMAVVVALLGIEPSRMGSADLDEAKRPVPAAS
ncbi:MFS transporter [Bosea sp. BK604]|uniref:MFS transporter n=1 Tax=Bosea sp. BK604 TaxID=2512180 RepID=UPI001046593B|nr:MFS transporter [Bosea sp. BK604]TCR70460.1 putative MFS transporter [Bosea sp. BK604]